MADEILKKDQNGATVAGAVTDDSAQDIRMMRIDDASKGLKVMIVGGTGAGSVTSVSVVTANGFAGTVANPTTTPAITLTTTITGILKGNGTAISAAVSNTDYQAPITLTTTGSSGAATFNGTTLNIPQYSGGSSGITIGTTTITSGTTTRVLYDNAGVVGEYVVSGSGNVAMTTSPSFTTPALGVATGTSFNGLVVTTTTGTFTLTNAKTFAVTNSLTLSGTDSSTLNIGTGGTLGTAAYTNSTAYEVPLTFSTGLTRSTNTITVNTTQNILKLSNLTSNGIVTTSGSDGTLSVTATTGSGSVVLATSPVLTTPNLGTPSAINLTNGTALPVAGITSSTSTALGVGSLELGAASDTTLSRSAAGVLAVEGVVIPSISSTNTITNKRNQPRTASSTTASTLTPDLSSANVYYRTTQTATLTINAPTGTPVIGETIIIYVDSAGAQTLTIDSTYKVFGAAFPATTTAGKTFMMSSQYNGTDWKTLWANAV